MVKRYLGESSYLTDWSSDISNLHDSIIDNHFHTQFSSCLIVVFQLLFKSDYKLWGYKSHSIMRTLTGHMPPSTMEGDLCKTPPHLRAWFPLPRALQSHVNTALKGAFFLMTEQTHKPKCCSFLNCIYNERKTNPISHFLSCLFTYPENRRKESTEHTKFNQVKVLALVTEWERLKWNSRTKEVRRHRPILVPPRRSLQCTGVSTLRDSPRVSHQRPTASQVGESSEAVCLPSGHQHSCAWQPSKKCLKCSPVTGSTLGGQFHLGGR